MCRRFNFVELFITKLEKTVFVVVVVVVVVLLLLLLLLLLFCCCCCFVCLLLFFQILRASPEVIAAQDEEHLVAEVLLYVHGNRRFFRDGRPGRPPRLSHSS